MLISHRMKFAFFRVPKSGSTTMEFMLRMTDAFDKDDIVTGMQVGGFKQINTPDFGALIDKGLLGRGGVVDGHFVPADHMHLDPSQAIEAEYITQAQLEEYTVFTCVRHPLKRYLSAFRHANRKIPDPGMFQTSIHKGAKFGLLTKPTHDYLYCNGVQVADPLDFEHYLPEIQRMLACVSDFTFPVIPKMNARHGPLMNDAPTDEHYWTPELKEKVCEVFAEDVLLYDSMKAGDLCLTH